MIFRKLLPLVILYALAPITQAQSLAELLTAVQQRKMALLQREAVRSELQKDAETQANGSSSLPLTPVDTAKLIQWGHGIPPFPSASEVNGLSVGDKLDVLNRAVRATDRMKEHYLNLDTSPSGLLYSELGYLAALPHLGSVTDDNWRSVIVNLASQLEQMVALDWPMACQTSDLRSSDVSRNEETPGPAPTVAPGYPFLSGASGEADYTISRSLTTASQMELYRWYGSGAGYGDYVEVYSGVNLVTAVSSKVACGGSVSNSIANGKLVFFKQTGGKSTFTGTTQEYLKSPTKFWRPVKTETDTYSWGIFGDMTSSGPASSTSSGLAGLETATKTEWQVAAMHVEPGGWHLWMGSWFMYGWLNPKYGQLPYEIGEDGWKLGSPSYAEFLRCVCYPAFTVMQGRDARKYSGSDISSAGEIETPLSSDKIRIHLGSGRYDRSQSAWLDSRMDGFGSPVFRGSANAFKVVFEYKDSNFPHKLVPDDYPPEEEFTPEDTESTGWFAKWQYLGERGRPRIRQIYGSDVVVDIVYVHDYRKEIRFFWAKNVEINPDSIEAPVGLPGDPFKTIIVENATTGTDVSFPSSPRYIHIFDGALHIDLRREGEEHEAGSQYIIDGGTSKGANDLFSRTLNRVSSSKFQETFQQGSKSWITDTEYYVWMDDDVPQLTFDRFKRSPFPTKISQGGRIVERTASPYPPPLTETGDPDYHASYLPLTGTVTYTGQNWDKDGAQAQWNPDGTQAMEKQTVKGKLYQVNHTWSGSARTSSHKLAGQSFRTETATYLADLSGLTLATEAGNTVVTYDAPNGTSPWSVRHVQKPGGHETLILTVPGEDETSVSIQEGWGPGFTSGTYRYLTTNRWGGVKKDTTWATTTSSSVKVSEWTGTEHTGWGQPSKVTDLWGGHNNTTFHTNGPSWGLPASWTTSTGVSGSVSGYDPLLRPTGVDTGFSNLVPDYSNPLQAKVNVTGQGMVSSDFNTFGELTKSNDARPGGAELDLTPGSAFVKVDGRPAGLHVSDTREIQGRDGGMGSRGLKEDWIVEGGRLCRVSTGLDASNDNHTTTKTYYDGLGRVIKVTSPGPNGQVSQDWAYNDGARTVQHFPVTGPHSKVVTQTLSADGSQLTVEEVNGTSIEYHRSANNGWLITTTYMMDDSNENPGLKQLSKSEHDPLTRTSRVTPWDLDDAKSTTTTTTAPGTPPTTTISSTGGQGATQTVTLKRGRPDRIEGQSGGVEYVLDDWDYQNERLTGVSGDLEGINIGMQWDSQGRLTREWGPGFDLNIGYGGAPGFEVTLDDDVKDTLKVLRSSAVGDLTEWSGDVERELSVTTQDLLGGQRSVTLKNLTTPPTLVPHLTLKQGGDGSLKQKDYDGGLVENLGYELNCALASFGTGPEAATVTYGVGDALTTHYAGGLDVTEDFYSVGLRKLVSGPNDSRGFKYLRGQLSEEKHTSGLWNGWTLARTQDDKGRVDGIGLSKPAETSIGVGYFHDQYGRVGAAGSAIYQYDTKGRLFKCFRDPLTTTWTYDAQGRVEDVHTVNTQGPDINFHHGYNPRGLRVTRTSTGGQSWTGMTYDSRGRLTGATLTNGTLLNYGYDDGGNRTSGGSAITYVINRLDQVRGRELGQRGYGVQGSVAPGARVQVSHPLAPDGEEIPVDPVTGAYHGFWSVTGSWSGGGVTQVKVLVRGTLTGAGTGGTDAVADKEVWTVVPATQEELTYDGAGRLVEDSEWVYTWNGMGHLTAAVRNSGTSREPDLINETLSFKYDSDGRRVEKIRTRTYPDSVTKEEVSRLMWDGWTPVFEDRLVDGVALARRKFVWGRDVSGTLDGAGGIGGLLAIHEVGGRTLLPVDDGLGNIVRIIDQATGNTVAKYDYAPYGEVVEQWGELEACPFRYQSKYFDAETGLSYFGFRYYSAKLGRWISRDPLGEAGGFNLYGYCGNDPVNKWDYLGMTDNPYLQNAWEYLIPKPMPYFSALMTVKARHDAGVRQVEEALKAGGLTRDQKVGLNKQRERLENLPSGLRTALSAADIVVSRGSAAATADNFVDGFYQAASTPGAGAAPIMLLKHGLGVQNAKVFQTYGVYEEDSAEDHVGKIGATLIPLPPIANAARPMARLGQVAEGWSPQLFEFLTRQRTWGNLSGRGSGFSNASKEMLLFSQTAGLSMDPSELNRIKAAFENAGHSMDIGSSEGVRRLDFFGVEASTLGDHITLRPNPSRSAVFEELIHATQNRLGRVEGTGLSRVVNEIEAQEKLIRFRKNYKIPRTETQQTIRALRDYRLEMQSILGN